MTVTITPVSFSLWSTDRAAFAQALGASLLETGFAIIEGHTIPQSKIDGAHQAAKDFFALPAEAKHHYFDPKGAGQRGYTPFGTENAKGQSAADLKEFWHTGRALPQGSPYREFMADTPEVTEVEDFDTDTRDLFEAFDQFGGELLEAIALYLELPQDWFADKVDMGNSILRLLHYPPQDNPPPAGTVRAGAHEDINLITLLLGAEEAGLQAKHRSGEWVDVNPPKGALVLNCGDMLQRLTAGKLPSTTHRVLNPSPERAKFPRYSMPFFLHPNADFLITPLPSCLAEGYVGEPPITALDYLTERLIEIGLIKP
ncbi:isopenicillin N synthase family dioxygenase [Litorimonas sp. RW-G-Af-16]|uniref:isopenicillin N synthase family dioxygenase n=1 Tax=Litorimonas sp. RW-G-Af-16 TaxID=3241168 RepID=UPI00390CC8D9